MAAIFTSLYIFVVDDSERDKPVEFVMDMEIGEPDKRSRTLWILIALIALSSVTTVEASRGGQSRSRDRDNGRHQPVTSSQTPDRRVRPADNGNHGNGQPNNGDRNEGLSHLLLFVLIALLLRFVSLLIS